MKLGLSSTRFFPIPRRKRWKGSTLPNPKPHLTWDAIRTSLEVLNGAADVCGPLKSATGAIIALCNIVDRVAACDSKTEQLAFRTVTVLDTIYNSIPEQETIPSHLIQSIAQFELVVNEIITEIELTANTRQITRVLRLRRTESKLVEFTERLDSTAEAFMIKNTTLHTMSLARIEDKVKTVSSVATALEHSNLLAIADPSPRPSEIPSTYGRFFGLTPMIFEPIHQTAKPNLLLFIENPPSNVQCLSISGFSSIAA